MQKLIRWACVFAVGALYFWVIGIGADHERFSWRKDLSGFYDLLARGFAGGKLYLPVEPKPELLALPNPYDEHAIVPYGLLDAVLYNRRYYLYHGAAPAIALFTPYRLLTRHDLPENFAAFLFAFGAYLFLSALFVQVLHRLVHCVPNWLLLLMLVTLGAGQCVPFVLHRVKVYEIAILSGYFYLSAGFYFLFRRLTAVPRPALWAGLSGLCFGLAIGCRPHMAVAAAAGFIVLLYLRDRRSLLAFSVPVAVCGLAIAAYNYARFGNPLDFGLSYQLGYSNYRNFHLSAVNVPPGLYYLLLCPPDLVPEFPFLRLALRQPFDSPVSVLPARYFIEPIAGVLWLSPVVIFGLLAPFWAKHLRSTGTLLAAMFPYSVGCILFVSATGLTSQRFEADFQPFLVFIACVVALALVSHFKDWRHIFAMIISVPLLLFGLMANLALAIQGPYDEFVRAHPQSYVRLARLFSPVERFQPLLNPRFRVGAGFELPTPCRGRQPLISAGEFGSRYLLSAECTENRTIRLISEAAVAARGVQILEVPLSSRKMQRVALEFTPADRIMSVTWNGRVVLRHELPFLITAPSQVHLGWDPTFGSKHTFAGRVAMLQPPEVTSSD
jgi:hypothetical protein